jgi:epsilon-lactone hydrolase
LISPIFGDLSGLPPLLIQVGSHEILLSDTLRLAERAATSDVTVTLDVTAGAPHVFQGFAGLLDEAGAALGRASDFMKAQRGSSRQCPVVGRGRCAVLGVGAGAQRDGSAWFR